MVEVGKVYREEVSSKIGYEDWEYTGNRVLLPNNQYMYAMKNDRGTMWFFENEINEMQIIH